MSTDTPTPPEVTYAIAYQKSLSALYNLDLRGRGTLTIRPAGPTWVFAGKARGFLSFSRQSELIIGPDQIRNVTVEGARVQFSTDLGRAGLNKRPFIFYADTPEAAAAIAAALPATQDTDFVESKAFAQQLQQIAGPGSAWTSVTNLIIAANVLAFVAMGLAGAGWIEVTDMMPYFQFGANRAELTTDGEWWRLASSMFLHFGLIHLLLNMWALLQVGHLVERLFGRSLFAIAYLGSGIAGSVASLLWHQHQPVTSAGASGAIFGVYGALLGYMLREKHALPKSVFGPLLKSTLVFAGYNLLYGLAKSGIDNAAHVGGFTGGIALGWLLAVPVDRAARARMTPARAGLGLAATAAIVGLGIGFAPHFTYRLFDELAWQDANKAPADQEPKIDADEQAAIARYQRTGRSEALVRWLSDEGIPFYREWRDRMVKLELAPGRLTARRREIFSEALRLKLESYEHLRTALQSGDRQALSHFQEDSGQVSAAIAKQAALEK